MVTCFVWAVVTQRQFVAIICHCRRCAAMASVITRYIMFLTIHLMMNYLDRYILEWNNKNNFCLKVTPIFLFVSTINSHVRWVPCRHRMVHPQVADGGDGLQIWRTATNILNKQSRTTDKEWSSSLGIGRGASNFSLWKISSSRNITKVLGPGRILWINDLRSGSG
jgi:hypothetical protein